MAQSIGLRFAQPLAVEPARRAEPRRAGLEDSQRRSGPEKPVQPLPAPVADEAPALLNDGLGEQLRTYLTSKDINPDVVGKVSKISLYQQASVDRETGEPVVTDLVAVQITPGVESGPAWPVVQQAAPVAVFGTNYTPALVGRWQHAVILPDPQIGYFRVGDELLPFHDERAMNVGLQVMAAVQHEYGVRKVVNLGDFLDLPEQSRFATEAGFAQTTQLGIDRGSKFLAEQRATAPEADVVLVEGNHDKRLQRFVTQNAISAFGLRRANAPESWPVMSLPYLLRCDELNVDYIDAWPAGEYWINDSLRCIHGNKVRSGGSTANAYVKDFPGISTIFGHTHRLERHHQTKHDRRGPVRTYAASMGCLCRTDGVVPSYGSSVGIDGRPATHWEDWQQAVGVVAYTEDGDHRLMDVEIIDGVAVWQGREICAA